MLARVGHDELVVSEWPSDSGEVRPATRSCGEGVLGSITGARATSVAQEAVPVDRVGTRASACTSASDAGSSMHTESPPITKLNDSKGSG